jgi:hypothetical protein
VFLGRTGSYDFGREHAVLGFRRRFVMLQEEGIGTGIGAPARDSSVKARERAEEASMSRRILIIFFERRGCSCTTKL